jgi:DNA-binding transcriptional ArsR family regulator
VNAFEVLGDPVRRRILELLADADLASGQIVEVVGAEFGISQPAVSQHLRVLRESGFATVRPDGARRIYALDLAGADPVDEGLTSLRSFWERRLDALDLEIRRGRRARTVAAREEPT